MRPRKPLLVASLAVFGFLGGGSAGCGGQTVELGNGSDEGGGGTPDNGGAGGDGGVAGSMATGGAAGAAGSGLGGLGGGSGAGGAGDGGGAGMGGKGTLRFVDVSPVAEIDSEFIEDNPTLTADRLQIFFTSDRGGNTDVWSATRSTVDDTFSEPQRVEPASTSAVESSPAVSLDGHTLFVGLDAAEGGLGGYDIWALERTALRGSWGAPFNLLELNSPEDDIPRPPSVDNTVMPLGSRRSGEGYRTYLATRQTADDPFGEPELIAELAVPGQSTVDGFLTEDGLTLFFSSAASEGEGDLYYATRPDADSPFGPPTPITDLNTTVHDERDPWMSPDGTAFYFATDAEGTLDVFYARVSRE